MKEAPLLSNKNQESEVERLERIKREGDRRERILAEHRRLGDIPEEDENKIKISEVKRVERVQAGREGIKARLRGWGKEKLGKLRYHLSRGPGYMGLQSFNGSYHELEEICKQGTKEGREWRDKKGRLTTRIVGDPDVADTGFIQNLPWIVGHDDPGLGDYITVDELWEIVKEVEKE